MTDINEWTGLVGDVWAQEWQRTDRSFSELTAQFVPAIVAAAPENGTAIDIGCGAGEIAMGLAAIHHDLNVTGIDISQNLLDIARGRSAGLHNIAFEHGDAAKLATSHGPVDLYISRHGVMFFDDPITAFTTFHKAASPGAPLVFSCFRDWQLNGFASHVIELVGGEIPGDSPGPFAFASEDKVRSILSQAGWRDVSATPVDFNYIAGQGEHPVDDAMSFMRRIGPAARAIKAAPEDRRDAIVDGVRNICEANHQGDSVTFPSAAWIWTAKA